MRFFSLTVVLVLLIQFGQSQPGLTTGHRSFNFGFGAGMGYFTPDDVNSYIEQDLRSDNLFAHGNSDMFLNISLNTFVGYRVNDLIDVRFILDYVLSPKFFWINGSKRSYFFRRVSPGIISNLYLPFFGRSTLLFGAGPLVHNMKFEGFTSTMIGLRGKIGLLLEGSNRKELYVLYDSANGNPDATYSTILRRLDYSGIQAGVSFYF